MKYLMLLALLSGCANAKLVKRDYDNGKTRLTYKYKNGSSSANESRQMALNQAQSDCGGSYKIISEESKSELVGGTNSGITTNLVQMPVIYLLVECTKT